MSSVLVPPRVLLTWTASSLTTSFGGYRVYRRPLRTPAATWNKIGEITVPAGYTAATVEAQHNSFVDYDMGWSVSGHQWADGWQYAVTNVNATTGLESTMATTTTSAQPADAGSAWLTCNAAPWLNVPLDGLNTLTTDDSDQTIYAQQPAARNAALMRTRFELPYRSAGLAFYQTSRVGQDPLRMYRAAYASGNTFALHLQGDRLVGGLMPLKSVNRSLVGDFAPTAGMVETATEATGFTAADFNRAAGIVLNGSSQYLTVADNDLLDPSSSAFTVVVAAAFSSTASKYALSKGNAGVGNGYWIRTTATANQLQFFFQGATTSGNASETSATWFDGNVHVAVATSSGTAQALYRDGNTTAVGTSSTTHGSISNSTALCVGANNAGAAGFMAAAPVRAFAVYMRVLTATEIQAASYYLLGYPGYRMPYGASVFHDLRDTRCWNGIRATTTDLSGNSLSGTVAGSPSTRGIPWRLELLDRFG